MRYAAAVLLLFVASFAIAAEDATKSVERVQRRWLDVEWIRKAHERGGPLHRHVDAIR